MGEKIIVGPINKGLSNDREAFMIDNDSFPTLVNAYQWRGRVKRKRGTQLLGRLSRFISTTDGSGNLAATIILPFPILPGQVSFTVGTNIFTDFDTNSAHDPVNLLTTGPGTATLNRSTGTLTITTSNPTAAVIYFPSLPVMGLEDLALNSDQFPGTLGFDTTYSYNISPVFPYNIYDVSFYKNPPTGAFAGYTQKGGITPTPTALTWNGKDYQQFWTTNYQGALWATNGINVPFNPTNIGMQFAPSATITFVSSTPTTITLTITNSPLIIGDFVFLNEWGGTNAITLNFQTGYVTAAAPNTPPLATKTVTITFPNATLGAGPYTPGIVQYLTNRSDATKDNIRWYDGDPTNGSTTAPVYIPLNGWVNFMPPLSQSNFSISDLPPRQYYLVGARMIVPFKDRLLFIGPVVQASTGLPIYLQDTIVYSQNGTPYYTASFTGDPNLITTQFFPILVPINQTATANAYWEDQTGFGGFIAAGISQDALTVSPNEDVLIIGFNFLQTRLVYTGNDIVPFNLFVVNSELGSGSTFSIVNMDQGVITRGSRGIIITNQTSCQRIDLEIPDQVFQIANINNGSERYCAARDFINEWVYFTYPGNNDDMTYRFPDQTLQYNYRDYSWAIFNESYTTYGTFRKLTGFTWSTVHLQFPTWSVWNQPWNAGANTLEAPLVIGGNQQGFVIYRDTTTTGEEPSLTIQNIVGSTVTSPNHNLNENDYITISGVVGTLSAQVNGKIFQVQMTTANTFNLSPALLTGTYLGGGLITRLFVPFIQTKQFPVSWGMARKTRLGPQQYLLTTTPNAQIQLLIFLSQNENDDPALASNFGSVVPSIFPNEPLNNSLVYSSVLYTCPESTNLGLTPANVNLQMPTAVQQKQIWHRMNTSLIGDTVQVGFTISDDQMKSFTPNGTSFSITGVTSGTTTTLNTTANFSANQMVLLSGFVGGMTQLNGNIYIVISSTTTQSIIDVNSTTFDPYFSGGIAMPVAPINQTAEIELHSMVLDVSPSQVLA